MKARAHGSDWINSVAELRWAGDDWDDLWQRRRRRRADGPRRAGGAMGRDVSRRGAVLAVVVRDQERLVAALPLVHTRLYGVLSASTIPSNGWLPTGGGLLLDRETATDDVLDLLVGATASLPRQVLWLDEVALGVPRWQAFWNAVDRAGMPVSFQERYPVGRIEIDHDWEAYQSALVAGTSLQHAAGLPEACDPRRTAIRDSFAIFEPDEVERQLRRGFEIEDRSWKGEARSSVFARGTFAYFVRQAKQLAAWGQLRLAFLTLDARPIAFCYCFAAKGVCHTLKTGLRPRVCRVQSGTDPVPRPARTIVS